MDLKKIFEKLPKKQPKNSNLFTWTMELSKIGFSCQKEFHIFQDNTEVTIDFAIKRVIDLQTGEPVSSIDLKINKCLQKLNFEMVIKMVKSNEVWGLQFKDIPTHLEHETFVESWSGEIPEKFYNQMVEINLNLDFKILDSTPTEKVHEVIAKLALKDLFSDVQVLVDDQAYPCHKMILMARSEIFKRELGKLDKFEIKDFPYGVVRKSLEFLYTDQISGEEIDTNILAFAAKYKIQSLLEVSIRCLKAKINKENVMDILVTASKIDNAELIKSASDFCIKNRGQIRKMKNWDELKTKYPIIASKFLEMAVFSN